MGYNPYYLLWLVDIIEIKKGGNYLSCIEGKGGLKDFYCIAQNAALFVDLSKISFYQSERYVDRAWEKTKDSLRKKKKKEGMLERERKRLINKEKEKK